MRLTHSAGRADKSQVSWHLAMILSLTFDDCQMTFRHEYDRAFLSKHDEDIKRAMCSCNRNSYRAISYPLSHTSEPSTHGGHCGLNQECSAISASLRVLHDSPWRVRLSVWLLPLPQAKAKTPLGRSPHNHQLNIIFLRTLRRARTMVEFPDQVRWGRANYFIASAHDSGTPSYLLPGACCKTKPILAFCGECCRLGKWPFQGKGHGSS